MTSITRLTLRLRWYVALFWILLAAAGGLTATTTIERLTYSYSLPGQPGFDANKHIIAHFGIDGSVEPTIAFLRLPPEKSMYTAAGQAIAARTFAAAHRAGNVAVADYATSRDPKLITDAGHSTWALINMPNPDKGLGVGVVDRLGPVLVAAAPRHASVAVTGYAQLLAGGGGAELSVLTETIIGAFGALLVLGAVFGSAIAILPLVIAIPAILVTFLCVLGMTQLTEINYFVEYLAALGGLGIAIDYSLLIVTRWREERERGLVNEDAILAAVGSAGRSVIVSGTTVAIGLLSLVLMPVPFLRSIGFGTVLIPIVAICAAVTLLPAVLRVCGPYLDARRVWPGSTTYSLPWERWGRVLVRRKWLIAAIGIVSIVTLSAPALSMRIGEPRVASLSAGGPAGRAWRDLMRNGVPSGIVFPIQLLTHGGAAATARAEATVRTMPGIYTVLSPATSSFHRGNESLLTVIPHAEGGTAPGKRMVALIRHRLAHISGGVEVGGDTAEQIDFTNAVYGRFPALLIVVAILTFLVLARSLRSIMLAFEAVVLNALSLGVTYGFMVFFWQDGHGTQQVFGVSGTVSVRDWIPIVTFAVLFGLSIDYEVFVLARMREEYDRTGSTELAVVTGLARTGRLVTGAALILTVAFLSLAANPNVLVKIVATSLAVGIIVDAVLIRTLLVPALVALMGRWNWWMPGPIARLLGIQTSDG